MSQVCIDINLEDIRTVELIGALRHRHKLQKDDLINLSPCAIIDLLEEFDCPQSIIKELKEWANQPVVTIHKLIAWKEACLDSERKEMKQLKSLATISKLQSPATGDTNASTG